MDEIKEDSFVVIQSMYKIPDEYLIEYYLIVKTLKKLGAKKIFTFIPFFAYARQDCEFNPGEAVSFEIIANLIKQARTDNIMFFYTFYSR